jgi:transposase-like protein
VCSLIGLRSWKSEVKANETMTCKACDTTCQRFGKHRNGLRRFRCPLCKKTYTEAHKPALEGSYIPQDRIVLALRLLIEGNSLRSTQRITNLDINTIMKILVTAGEKCNALMGRLIVNIPGRATLWALGEDKARNEIFNVSNGDVNRWRQLWNELAAFYDLPIAEPLAMSTVSEMSEKAPLWDSMVGRYGLHATSYCLGGHSQRRLLMLLHSSRRSVERSSDLRALCAARRRRWDLR